MIKILSDKCIFEMNALVSINFVSDGISWVACSGYFKI